MGLATPQAEPPERLERRRQKWASTETCDYGQFWICVALALALAVVMLLNLFSRSTLHALTYCASVYLSVRLKRYLGRNNLFVARNRSSSINILLVGDVGMRAALENLANW